MGFLKKKHAPKRQSKGDDQARVGEKRKHSGEFT